MRLKTMIIMMLIIMSDINILAGNISYTDVRNAPNIRWKCPDVEQYQSVLYSLRDNDFRVYATKLKDKFQLYTNPKVPSDKSLVTITEIQIDNPLFNSNNLLNHISLWLKNRKEGWESSIKIDNSEKEIVSAATVHIANNSSFFNLYKVYVTPSLVIRLIDNNKLLVSLATGNYINREYSGSASDNLLNTYNPKITDVFPFVPKSSFKQTYARAYVGTYQYFWSFIASLVDDLNSNFTRDSKMITELHYQFANDSLQTRYGVPSKVIALQNPSTDINTELRFYENAQKVVFMGKTISFNDIMSCNIIDDPQFIPGHSSTYGAGISFFGIGLGGADTYTTPDKTIHNYVVDIKVDNLAIPFIRIATNQNEFRAKEIASVFDYILRHRQNVRSNASRPKGDCPWQADAAA